MPATTPSPAKAFQEFFLDLTTGSNLQPELVGVFYGVFAHEFYAETEREYLKKSTGGTDSQGGSWEPIKPQTKAYSRPDLRVGLTLPGVNPRRPTLTQEQDRAWRKAFVQSLAWTRSTPINRAFLAERERTFAFLSAQTIDRENLRRAGAIAWNRVKQRFGAQTLIGLLASRQAAILVRRGDLLESLKPAPATQPYTPRKNQIFRKSGTTLTLGSSVAYAAEAAQKRPWWPEKRAPLARQALAEGIRQVYQQLA